MGFFLTLYGFTFIILNQQFSGGLAGYRPFDGTRREHPRDNLWLVEPDPFHVTKIHSRFRGCRTARKWTQHWCSMSHFGKVELFQGTKNMFLCSKGVYMCFCFMFFIIYIYIYWSMIVDVFYDEGRSDCLYVKKKIFVMVIETRHYAVDIETSVPDIWNS